MKLKKIYICQECGNTVPKWQGKCNSCNQWNTFIEDVEVKKDKSIIKSTEKQIASKISEIEITDFPRINTNINELNRVLGGGLTIGSLTLIGGQPGIGKSTLLMGVASNLSKNGHKILYVSGEESNIQIAQRAKRLNVSDDNFFVLNENVWQNIHESIKELKPDILILDSIQTTISSELPSAAGSISQIREVTYELMNFCKSKNITSFIVGHVTKEGNIAGPKLLEHMVDTVVYFEGDQFGHYRILRSMKNRFGNTNEVGIFEMNEEGLQEVINPSVFFMTEGSDSMFGRSQTCILEGIRPLFIEIQALVVENKYGNGKRTTQGIDSNRLSLIAAVIEKYFEIPLTYHDIYVNVIGGLKLTKRDSDLSIIASILSSFYSKNIDNESVFLGEVGLTGEVRPLPQIELRLKEIAHLNYKKVYLPMKHIEYQDRYPKLKIYGIKHAKDLVSHLF